MVKQLGVNMRSTRASAKMFVTCGVALLAVMLIAEHVSPAATLAQFVAAHQPWHLDVLLVCAALVVTARALLNGRRPQSTTAPIETERRERLMTSAACADAQPTGAALRAALQAGEFIPYYQPIVSLSSHKVTGFEILARWNHPSLGLLPPDRFIHAMEADKLCAALSLSLLGQVIADARFWPPAWSFAFNASASQLQEMLDFVRDPAALPGGMLDPRRIELEITESILIEDMELARRVVRTMHKGGTKVVLDDFGTGYANFRQLRQLPFDRIKIDRSFVANLCADPRSAACLQAMVGMAHSLNATVIAEGVEDERTARRLRSLGCDFAQGYFYSRPRPAAEVLHFAAARSLKGVGQAA